MAVIDILDHSVVHINSEPHRTSEYVALPYVVALPDDTLLCACRHGTARESADGIVKIHRSTDGGMTWHCTGVLLKSDEIAAGAQWARGFAVLPDGEVVVGVKVCGQIEEHGVNFQLRSHDGGMSWSEAEVVDPEPFGAVAGVSEMTGLADGTIIATGEGRGDGDVAPAGTMVNLISRSADGGRTWDPVLPTLVSKNPFHFDIDITQLANGQLLAAYWTHDMETDCGINVHMSTSSDLGRSWTATRDSGFWGQRTALCALRSGRVLAVTNHRRAPFGIRAHLSGVDGTTFSEPDHVEVWGVEPATIRTAPVLAAKQDVEQEVLTSWHFFTFGTPSIAQLSDGTIVVLYYVTEESVTYVRCCRMRENL